MESNSSDYLNNSLILCFCRWQYADKIFYDYIPIMLFGPNFRSLFEAAFVCKNLCHCIADFRCIVSIYQNAASSVIDGIINSATFCSDYR